MFAWLRRQFLFRLLVVAPGIVAGAYFALWACAPAATLPSPAPMTAERPNEFGVSATGGVGFIDIDRTPLAAAGQIHFYRRLGPAGGLGATLFGGSVGFGGLGLVGRFTLHESDPGSIGLQLEGGWMWGAIALPAAIRFADHTWFTVTPSTGYRFKRSGEIAVGVASEDQTGLHVAVEAAFGVGEELNDYFARSEGMFSGRVSVLVAYRFGRRGQNRPIR